MPTGCSTLLGHPACYLRPGCSWTRASTVRERERRGSGECRTNEARAAVAASKDGGGGGEKKKKKAISKSWLTSFRFLLLSSVIRRRKLSSFLPFSRATNHAVLPLRRDRARRPGELRRRRGQARRHHRRHRLEQGTQRSRVSSIAVKEASELSLSVRGCILARSLSLDSSQSCALARERKERARESEASS